MERETTAQPLRLLLVDDEEGFAQVLAKRIAKRGIAVNACFSGSDAIQALRREDFDVVVLDLKMQDMDGIEVLKVFKKMVPAMPVIMLTGHGSEQSAAEGMAQGACDYLSKPYEFEDLLERIREAARKGGGSRER
jgi:DNA-binding response OmpR family regulator